MKLTKCNFCKKNATNMKEDSFEFYELCDDCKNKPRVQELLKGTIEGERNCDKQNEHNYKMAYGYN